jgi:hypothetical protein
MRPLLTTSSQMMRPICSINGNWENAVHESLKSEHNTCQGRSIESNYELKHSRFPYLQSQIEQHCLKVSKGINDIMTIIRSYLWDIKQTDDLLMQWNISWRILLWLWQMIRVDEWIWVAKSDVIGPLPKCIFDAQPWNMTFTCRSPMHLISNSLKWDHWKEQWKLIYIMRKIKFGKRMTSVSQSQQKEWSRWCYRKVKDQYIANWMWFTRISPWNNELRITTLHRCEIEDTYEISWIVTKWSGIDINIMTILRPDEFQGSRDIPSYDNENKNEMNVKCNSS